MFCSLQALWIGPGLYWYRLFTSTSRGARTDTSTSLAWEGHSATPPAVSSSWYASGGIARSSTSDNGQVFAHQHVDDVCVRVKPREEAAETRFAESGLCSDTELLQVPTRVLRLEGSTWIQ